MGKKKNRPKKLNREQRQDLMTQSKIAKVDPLQPKYGELPEEYVMDAIAESLHAAVSTVIGAMEKSGGGAQTATENPKIKGLCLYYAAAGQYVASVILGRDYCVQVGSLGVETDEEHLFKIDASNGGVAARRFHMWLAANDGGLIEYVDFTSRFFKDWALGAGLKWEREDLPAYLWGKQKDIKEQHGVYFEYRIEEEDEADKQVTANNEVIALIARQAIEIAREKLQG